MKERVACDVCGAAAGERCRHNGHVQGCSCCLAIKQLIASGMLHCAGGDREVSTWFPELEGTALAAAIAAARTRERERATKH